MLHVQSLAICLVAAISLTPAAQAVTPTHPPALNQPAKDLHAQLTIIIGGNPIPYPQPIIIERSRYPEPVYRESVRREVLRDRYEEYSHRNHKFKHHNNKGHRRDEDRD